MAEKKLENFSQDSLKNVLIVGKNRHKFALLSFPRESGCQDHGKLSEAERIRLTPFERVVYDMAHNEKMVNDLILGRRVGFYELRGEIGQGNFSSVRLGIHALTKGLLFYLRYLFTLPISLCLYICILFYY
uniref:Protein kinase domain-containing protein n=1 Tax=Hippocampus comes TaxID=109280 RepID=A0A3Q2XN29_HIPCM